MVNRMDDYIKRQSVIDAIHKSIFDFFDICDDDEESPMTYKDEQLLKLNKAITTRIKAVPSAQSVTPMHWIPVNPFNGGWSERWKCSACGSVTTLGYCTNIMEYDFCPRCGARMDGEQNDRT